MATNKIYILQLITILFILISCKNKPEISNEVVILKAGDYTLTKDEFDYTILKLQEINTELSKEELELMVFDNFISVGILAESAKKHNYIQSKEFRYRYENEFQKPLTIKHNQYLQTRKNSKGHINYNKILDYKDKGLNVDYIRIPKEQRAIAEKMFEFFKSGASYSDIKKNPEYEKWENLGVSFYEDIPLSSAIFTKRILNEIAPLNNNDIKFIKEHTSYYVLRMKQSGELPYGNKDKKIHLLNTLMGQSLENGDLVFDRFNLEKSINCNSKLLSEINFLISPLNGDASYSDNVIAKLNGEYIYEKDVKQKILELPIEFRSLFYNRSVRKQAIATLILAYSQLDENSGTVNFCPQKLGFERKLENELAINSPNDTVEFMKTWIVNNLAEIRYIDSVTHITAKNGEIKSGKVELKNVITEKGLKSVDDWLSPEKFIGNNELRLNYEAIESMDLYHDISGFENVIIAESKSKNWHLRVKGLVDELKKLSPETRVDIVKNNLLADLIEYLAKRDTKTKKIDITINSTLFDKIDIIGNSYDVLNAIVNESDTVGSLGETFLTLKKTRLLFDKLPKRIKDEIFSDFKIRKDVFQETLIEQFWLDFYDQETLKSDPGYINEKKRCQNIILVELFYNHEIKVPSFEIDNNELKMKYNAALQIINDKRLFNFLQEAASHLPIEINTKLLKDKYGLDLSSSQFFKNIQEYKQ